MMTQTKPPFFGEAEPAWEIAELFSAQGEWTEEEYLSLNTNRLVEYSHGHVEVLPMPSQLHQGLVFLLAQMLQMYVASRKLGKVLIAPLPVHLWPGKYREPDVVFMLQEHSDRRLEQHWIGADLVMEVISPDDRRRDVVDKRREYAQARIPEYWLVDPQYRTITVLTLEDDRYAEHGHFGEGEQASSRLLPGFTVDVAALFAEAQA
ncbi:MAG: Uma2 family endonuclease [Chloroflexi bacterium]|nr:MAG: Uma2 family endonuclease [Chloroflexota bacterium]